MESQTKLRTEIEKVEAKLTEDKLGKIYDNSKTNPNTIREARKRARGCNALEYNTITEDGKQHTEPNENKDHIVNCFEDLYQAREGTEEYKEWTEQITNPVKIALRNSTATPTPTPPSQEEMISDKEMQNSIKKKLKRKKTPAP